MKAYLSATIALLMSLATCLAWSVSGDLPFLTGRIVDNAEVLSPAASEKVSALLKAHETRTSEQIVVLTTPSLEGQSIEE
ncbi:MAG TPA: TPM domain-containing protein, partial [Burkholderiales bacterium]|nr:TPM domain-containing protein [Burkholderiales bacterium]